MNKIQHFIEYGILAEANKIKRDVNIWQLIAKNVPTLKRADLQTQKLFVYLQRSSQTNFILCTSKIYETPRKKYETMCLLKIISVLPNSLEQLDRKKHNMFWTMQLEKFNCKKDFISEINSTKSELESVFCDHYKKRLESDHMKKLINEVFLARDKYVAHSEYFEESTEVQIATIVELAEFAIEFGNVFNLLFEKEIYFQDLSGSDYVFVENAINKLSK